MLHNLQEQFVLTRKQGEFTKDLLFLHELWGHSYLSVAKIKLETIKTTINCPSTL
jgi:hypothetical protein